MMQTGARLKQGFIFTVASVSCGVLLLSIVVANTAAAATQVYQCSVNGQKVFSDRVCGGDSTRLTLESSNRMDSREAGPSRSSREPNSKPDRLDPQAKAAMEKATQCERLRADKAAVDSRMRAGYSAQQGERLKDRLRKINADYYDLRCAR